MVLKAHSGKNLIVLTGEVWRTSRSLDIQGNPFAVCHRDKASLYKMLLHPNAWALWFFFNPLHIPFACLRFPEMLLLIWILPFLQGYTCKSVHIIITYVKAFLRIKMNHINYYTRNIGISYNSSIQVRACGHSILWKLPHLFLSWLSHSTITWSKHLAYIVLYFYTTFLCDYYLISHFKMSENFEIRDYLIFFVIKPFPESLNRGDTQWLLTKIFLNPNLHWNKHNKIHSNTAMNTWWLCSFHIISCGKNLIYVVMCYNTKSPIFIVSFLMYHITQKKILISPCKHI